MRCALRVYVAFAAVATAGGIYGCRASLERDNGANVATDGANATSYDGMPQIMNAAKMAAVKNALPQVAYPALQAILTSPATMWYDDDSMLPTYQDSVGDISYTPVGARRNSEGKGLIVPEGKKFFSADGSTWAFPFGHTAGMDTAENALIVDFLSLPVGTDGKPLPVVYSTYDANDLHRWTWVYPKGAMLGELIFVQDSAGNMYPSELRTRVRYGGGWATNSFRPFPTAVSLAVAIKAARPNWEAVDKLKAFVAYLENNATLTAKTQGSPGFNDLVVLKGAVDNLPDMGDDALVKELLTKTPFVSSYGEPWKFNGDQKAYGANATTGLSIVPRGNQLGLIEVSDDSCNRCHDNAGRKLADYEWQTELYGDLWGEDRIFSFNPYDATRIHGAVQGSDNRAVRKEFSGIVQRFDKSKHPSDIYKELPRVGN